MFISSRRVLHLFINASRRSNSSLPVLCYHALHASGPQYRDNDHVALEEDLQAIRRSGYRIIALSELAEALRHPNGKGFPQGRFVCLTFDDGPNVDYFDYADPVVGLAKSFHRILVEFRVTHPDVIVDLAKPLAVSFLIASEEARTILDRSCIAGRGDWSSCWWRACAAGGVIALGNHGWDHLHVSLPSVAQRDQRKGSFHAVDNDEDARTQVTQAREYIEAVLGMPCTRFFAYPYGHASK